MPAIEDAEFGTITLRRSKLSRSVKLKMDARGVISISLPLGAPLYLARNLLHESRTQLRQLLHDTHAKRPQFSEGDMIGASHRLLFITTNAEEPSYLIEPTRLIIKRAGHHAPHAVIRTIEEGAQVIMRTQAKAHLPGRLAHFARVHGFTYNKIRFSNADTRWGSCSSNGTISLNVWLMQLPRELIDYVLLHELCHTRHMNHSDEFWELVASLCPDYAARRRLLKQFHPYV